MKVQKYKTYQKNMVLEEVNREGIIPYLITIEDLSGISGDRIYDSLIAQGKTQGSTHTVTVFVKEPNGDVVTAYRHKYLNDWVITGKSTLMRRVVVTRRLKGVQKIWAVIKEVVRDYFYKEEKENV